MMKISLIAALSKNYVIGFKNQMPWHLPADLQHFKQLTLGKPVLMGRKTYESIGKALPNRRNMVISTQAKLKDAEVFSSIEEALDILSKENVAEVMIIGGEQIFKQLLPKANTLYLTLIDAEFTGDTFFPRFDPQEWKEVSKVFCSKDNKDSYDFYFVEYQRSST